MTSTNVPLAVAVIAVLCCVAVIYGMQARLEFLEARIVTLRRMVPGLAPLPVGDRAHDERVLDELLRPL